MIGLVATAECYGHKESIVYCVSPNTAPYLYALSYTLCGLSKFADQGSFDRSKSLGNNLP